MQFYKNIEISKKFKVSPRTVTNWINSALKGKNLLELVQSKNKFFIKMTAANELMMIKMSTENRKFISATFQKKCRIQKEFYDSYSTTEIIEIINMLEKVKEIPHKFSYKNKGAELWEDYVKKTFDENLKNVVTNTSFLLNSQKEYITSLCEGNKINVIDIGVGDSRPVKQFLEFCMHVGVLNSYVGVDFSREMLDIAEENIHSWFGESVKFKRIEYDIMKHDLASELFDISNKSGVVNVILFLGSTIENLDRPELALHNIYTSMVPGDIFILGETTDNQNMKAYFFQDSYVKSEDLFAQSLLIPKKLGLVFDEDYDLKMSFNPELNQRQATLHLKHDIVLEFEINDSIKKVELKKDEEILVWRHRHNNIHSVMDRLEKHKFRVNSVVSSKDESSVITICRI